MALCLAFMPQDSSQFMCFKSSYYRKYYALPNKNKHIETYRENFEVIDLM